MATEFRLSSPTPALIRRDLAMGPATTYDLMREIGVGYNCIRKWLRRMHADREIHIGGWERSTTYLVPLWTLGSAKDKPWPGRKPRKEYTDRYRAIHRDRYLASHRASQARYEARMREANHV